MIARPPLPGGPYLVVGLARSGVAAALALRARGEQVVGVDAGAPDAGRLAREGVEVHLDDPGVQLLDRVGTLVKSPGVPHTAAVVEAARARGLAVVGELELAWRLLPNDFIAVTGTNGKTTTTEWIGHVHREAGLPVAVAGNVGTPVSALVGELDPAADGRLRGVLVPARGHRPRSRPTRRCCSTSRPTTSTGTGRSRRTVEAKLRRVQRQRAGRGRRRGLGRGVEMGGRRGA